MCIKGTFDSYVFKVSLMSFYALPIFNNLVSGKRLVLRQNGLVCTLEVPIQYISKDTFGSEVFELIVFSAFPIFDQFVSGRILERNGLKY